MKLLLKRIYELPENSDGYRILVDRLWPRGVSKEKAKLDLWTKELAPTTKLRQWFSHDPVKFPEFCTRYLSEIKQNPVLPEFLEQIKDKERVTLLYAAKDTVHNEAIVLKEYLESL